MNVPWEISRGSAEGIQRLTPLAQFVFINKLANSMEPSPPSEANSSSATQEFPNISWNQ
jgi:hypothetical protein